MLDMTPLHRLLGFRLESFDAENGIIVIACQAGEAAERADGAGQAHGGAIATLIDSAACYAACILARRSVPTMNLHVDYLRPASGPEMTATARVVRAGRTAAVVDVEVMSAGKLVAVGRCTELMLNP